MLQTKLEPRGGFSFENCQRNASLERAFPGLRVPHARKTGTTIAGLVFRDGVILGADKRATNDSVVADKNCDKIHFIAPKIYCCGAGVAADTEMTTQMAASNMELHALSTGREPRVATVTRILRQTLFRCWGKAKATLGRGHCEVGGVEEVGGGGGNGRGCKVPGYGRGWPVESGKRMERSQSRGSASREGAGLGSWSSFVGSGAWVPVCGNNRAHSLLRYRGHVGASLVVGGIDPTGPQLYSVHPHGSYSRLLFTALGSGQDAALAVLEDRFQPNMTLEAAQELLVEAITAGILGDLGSGGSVDACVITATGAKMLRKLSSPTKPIERPSQYLYAPGTTAVLSETVVPLSLELVEETVQTMEME